MNELETIWEVFKDRERRDEARQMAKDYVSANRATLEAEYAALTEDDCVTLVGLYKRQGNMQKSLEVKTWILAEYPPKQIVGTMGPPPRAGA